MSVALDRLDIHQVLFLDIETVPAAQHFAELSPRLQHHWQQKAATRYREFPAEDASTLFEQHGGLYAEFGRIVCVSVGLLQDQPEGERLFLKSFAGTDEALLLRQFGEFVAQLSQRPDEPQRGRRRVTHLCAHNGCEFDFPYLCRRMLVHAVPLPDLLNLQGRKPWEVPHVDTMQQWTFGDRKAFTRLDLLAEIFGIQSPKDDIDGSDIRRVFYEEADLPRIVEYCQKDVVTIVRVLQRMMYRPPLAEGHWAVIA